MNNMMQYELEFTFSVSPKLLYTMISKPEGLSRWFADSVYIEEDVYHFVWADSEQMARLIESKENEFVRFEWVDDFHEGCILELSIQSQEVSQEIALLIKDCADSTEMDYYKRLWSAQVVKLQRLFNA